MEDLKALRDVVNNKFRNHRDWIDYLNYRQVPPDSYVNMKIKDVKTLVDNMTEWVIANVRRYGNCECSPITYNVVKSRLRARVGKTTNKVVSVAGMQDTILIEKC